MPTTVKQTIEYVITNCNECPFLRITLIPNFISAESYGVRMICDADYRLIEDVVWYWGKGHEMPEDSIPSIPDWCTLDRVLTQIGLYVKDRIVEL
jgi:hypothetical protein